METYELILKDREKVNDLIKSLVKCNPCISVKSNIIGLNKNRFEAYFLLNYFETILDNIPHLKKHYIDGFDGPRIIYETIDNNLKDYLVKIEEENFLGRLIDIDFYKKGSSKSESRIIPRKCLLCSDYSFNCRRSNKHNMNEYFLKMDKMIEDCLYSNILQMIDYSIEKELSTPNKFGCVSTINNGSHSDMDFVVMREAKKTIAPYLLDMFKVGYNCSKDFKSVDFESLFDTIYNIGIDCNKEMLIKTNGVNCYKGLIFSFGLLLTSIGFAIKNMKSYNDLPIIISKLATNIKKYKQENTYGKYLLDNFNIKGARELAIEGLDIVFKSYELMTDLKYETLIKVFKYITLNINDTVMIKRCKSLSNYYILLEKIKLCDVSDDEKLRELNEYCINNNISAGGSADILVCAIFLKSLNEFMNIKGERL